MTRHLKTGLFIRDDDNLGLIVYSPFTGLLFSCLEEKEGKQKLIRWLEGNEKQPPDERYLRALGAGWALKTGKAGFPRQHRLSSTGMVHHSYKPDTLLVVNWLITGRCSCECRYCYSHDLMVTEAKSMSASRIRTVAKQILKYRPLAVVLTGGDPLEYSGIEVAFEALHGKTGIIVDTNGIGITKEKAQLFREYNAFVRVSLDSERPRVNNKLRPTKIGVCSLESALKCINLCMEHQVGVGVQTVVTSLNMSDIGPLGHKLHRLGITSWRLLVLTRHSCFDDYRYLEPNTRRLNEKIMPDLGIVSRKGWDEVMSIQKIDNNVSNSVVLVAPDGRFLTEFNGKVPLSEDSPCRPSMDEIIKGPLNLDAHTERYLNISPGNDRD